MPTAAGQCLVDTEEHRFGPFWMLWIRLEKQDKMKTVTLENRLVVCQLMMSKKENTK